MHTMPRGKLRPTLAEVKALLAQEQDFLRPLVQAVLQELLEAEMSEALGAQKGERTAARLGYRSGYYDRTLVSRVGKLELRVPQDRAGRFSTELFERYQRSEKALVAALAEMYVQGVSTRKVKAITEELCGHSFSASAISAINVKLDEELARFARRRLDEAYPYLIVDARYERVREEGIIRSQAVLLAIGIGWDGRRSILAVELANRESRSSWRDFLLGLRERGLSGVEFVVSDDHAGLRQAIVEVLPEAAWQRCYVHFLRNALDYVPRKVDDDCLRELRWLYDRRDLTEAKRDLAAWLVKWQATYPKLCGWVEEHIEETLSFYRLPRQHHKHLKSTDEIDKSFCGPRWYAGGARATAWRTAGRRLRAPPGCLIRWTGRRCGARAPVGWRGGGRRAERPSMSLARRAALADHGDPAADVDLMRRCVGFCRHWPTRCS
jgi:putative transposase